MAEQHLLLAPTLPSQSATLPECAMAETVSDFVRLGWANGASGACSATR